MAYKSTLKKSVLMEGLDFKIENFDSFTKF